MRIALIDLIIICYIASANALKCFERYKFLDPIDAGANDETKEVVCPGSTTSCGDALVAFQDPSGSPMKLNVKFCGGNSAGVTHGGGESGGSGSGSNGTKHVGKAADQIKTSATNKSVKNPNFLLNVDVESEVNNPNNTSNSSNVGIFEFCDGINATVAREGWSDVSCQETRCVNDLCNGLKCFQPIADCVKNLTLKGPSEATLGNVAACPSQSRQCDLLDVSACVSVEIKTKAKGISIRGCHSKGSQTFCQRLLQRSGHDKVDCKETFCVTNDCNKPDDVVVVFGIVTIIAAAFLGVAVIIIIILVARICCCESNNNDDAKKNKNGHFSTEDSSFMGKEKDKQKAKDKQNGKNKGKSWNNNKSAEKSYSAISLVRRFDMSKTRDHDQDDSYDEISDFDS